MRSSETGLQVSARPASRASREGGSAVNCRRARRTEIPWVSVLLQYGGAGAAAHPRGSRGALREAWLEPVSVADGRGFRSHEMTQIREIVMEDAGAFGEIA